MSLNLSQIIQIAGSLLVVTAFILSQRNVVDARSYVYLLLNLIGGATLAVLAWQEKSWGFLLLEGAWALVAVGGLAMRLLGKEPAATH